MQRSGTRAVSNFEDPTLIFMGLRLASFVNGSGFKLYQFVNLRELWSSSARSNARVQLTKKQFFMALESTWGDVASELIVK